MEKILSISLKLNPNSFGWVNRPVYRYTCNGFTGKVGVRGVSESDL